jgi:hypothetical protein
MAFRQPCRALMPQAFTLESVQQWTLDRASRLPADSFRLTSFWDVEYVRQHMPGERKTRYTMRLAQAENYGVAFDLTPPRQAFDPEVIGEDSRQVLRDRRFRDDIDRTALIDLIHGEIAPPTDQIILGRTQNVRAWAREIGIGWRALQQRLAKGWPLEQALSAGNRELYKGKPTLAPLARKAGVPPPRASRRKAAGHPMEKVLQPSALSHPPQHPLTFGGQTKSMTEWADELCLSQSALSMRLSRGWSMERALSWKRKPKE